MSIFVSTQRKLLEEAFTAVRDQNLEGDLKWKLLEMKAAGFTIAREWSI
jgi:hypothetical protein